MGSRLLDLEFEFLVDFNCAASFTGVFLVGSLLATLDALEFVLDSDLNFESVAFLLKGLAFTFLAFSGVASVDIFAICLELFLGVDVEESAAVSVLAETDSFLVGDCVDLARPLDGEETASSTVLCKKNKC